MPAMRQVPDRLRNVGPLVPCYPRPYKRKSVRLALVMTDIGIGPPTSERRLVSRP